MMWVSSSGAKRKNFDRTCRRHSVNKAKYVFGAQSVQYLGYQIDKKGAKPVSEKVEAIINFPKLKTIEELRRFLVVVNFYWRFLKNAAAAQAPLTELLKEAKKIIHLNYADSLTDPKLNNPLQLITDASDVACVAVLQQEVNGLWEPIAFSSKKFSPTEIKYNTIVNWLPSTKQYNISNM